MTAVSRPMVVCIWTENAAESNVVALAEAAAAQSGDIGGVNVILCPPFASLAAVCTTISGTDITIGAPALRDKHGKEISDEIAAAMLANRCEYALVGHWRWDETMNAVASETAAALRCGMRPILCVFDHDEHHRRGEPIGETVRRQIEGALSRVDFELPPRSLTIAYEPAWTFQSRQTLSAERASEILETIRRVLAQRLGAEIATSIPLLYAGRVNPSDAEAFAAAESIDGVVVVDEEVDAADFMQIVRAFSKASRHRAKRPAPSPALMSQDAAADDIGLTTEQQANGLLLKRSLVPVISELESALQFLGEREAQGLQLVQQRLEEFHEWENIIRVGEIGEEFDPDIHRAIGTDDRSDCPSRTVVEIVRTGYRIEGQIVQKAEVIVNL